jgi:hypothetical protein
MYASRPDAERVFLNASESIWKKKITAPFRANNGGARYMKEFNHPTSQYTD